MKLPLEDIRSFGLLNSAIQYYNLKPTKYNLLSYSSEFALVSRKIINTTAGSCCYIIEISWGRHLIISCRSPTEK